jgi:hypothetical protein
MKIKTIGQAALASLGAVDNRPVITGLVLAGLLAVVPFALHGLNVGNTVPARVPPSAPPAAARH